MSDQHNIYDNLREDEERSEEGSVMGSDTADFFVDDEAPIRTPGTADVTDILVNTDSDVSTHMFQYGFLDRSPCVWPVEKRNGCGRCRRL
jgi:hypothetical protein